MANANSYQLRSHCENLDESIFALDVGGISPVVGVVGDGGAAAATQQWLM